MRVFVLTIALLALAVPAFANCGGDHTASTTSSTVATTSAPQTTSSAPSGG
jgi:predicted S18 family serine protease